MRETSQPIYMASRQFLGDSDLVVSFLTKKCQFTCNYCVLPASSLDHDPGLDAVLLQLERVRDYTRQMDLAPTRLSTGNEGSILDRHRFPERALDELAALACSTGSVRTLSLETRPEYVTSRSLQRVVGSLKNDGIEVEVTIGFETLNDQLRHEVLGKSVTRRSVELAAQRMSDEGVSSLVSYVMLRPGPAMSEEEGVQEAIATVEYLCDISERFKLKFTPYVVPLYIAKGSSLAESSPQTWIPPTLQNIVDVVLAIRSMNLLPYVGLWHEGKATPQGDFTSMPGYEDRLRQAIAVLSATGRWDHLDELRAGVSD